MLMDPQRTNTQTVAKRKRIWELVDLQCPIIGTCLTLGELRKIARQSDVEFPDNVSEFDIHSYFVSCCKEPSRIARLVTKKLDRKYAAKLRRYGSCKDDDAIRTLWVEDREHGDIPGPFWAVISHAHTSTRLRTEVFGEVHMLSHLVGSANRADIRRLSDLEAEQERLTHAMQRMKTVFADRVRALQGERNAMADQVDALKREMHSLSTRKEDAVPPENKTGETLQELEAEMLRRELDEAWRERNEVFKLLEAESRRLEYLESENRELAAENRVLEEEIARLLEKSYAKCPDGCAGKCPCPDLCGMCVLYVGGRTGLVPQYRALVESRGGTLIHHDGGMEEAPKRLESVLAQADAVVCPVDCVSHEACTIVKSYCKRALKPCFMMRTAGISSLAKTVSSLPEQSCPPNSHAVSIIGAQASSTTVQQS